MQETISEAVYEAMQQVNVVTDEDRAVFQEMYGYPVEEADDRAEDGADFEYYYEGEYGDYNRVDTRPRVTTSLGGEVMGDRGDDNSDFTALICEALLAEGDVKQELGPKVYKEVKKALDAYPKRVINGKTQNYFRGSPEEFAEDLAGKINARLEDRGLVSKIAGFLKLRK